jgi:hypothetical protein
VKSAHTRSMVDLDRRRDIRGSFRFQLCLSGGSDRAELFTSLLVIVQAGRQRKGTRSG